jgi:hypothetical protein
MGKPVGQDQSLRHAPEDPAHILRYAGTAQLLCFHLRNRDQAIYVQYGFPCPVAAIASLSLSRTPLTPAHTSSEARL